MCVFVFRYIRRSLFSVVSFLFFILTSLVLPIQFYSFYTKKASGILSKSHCTYCTNITHQYLWLVNIYLTIDTSFCFQKLQQLFWFFSFTYQEDFYNSFNHSTSSLDYLQWFIIEYEQAREDKFINCYDPTSNSGQRLSSYVTLIDLF